MTQAAILILTQCYPPEVGGIERLMSGLSRALFDAGFAVEVFADASRAEGGLPTPEGPALRRFGGPKPLRRLWKAAAARRRLMHREAARPGSTRSSHHGGVAAVVADSWKSLEHLSLPDGAPPIACLAHGMEFPSDPQTRKGQRVTAALAKASIVIANSADTAARAEPFAPGRVRVVHPPAEPPPAPPPEALARMRERLLPLGAGPVILTLARLEPRKGVDRLIAALPRLPAAGLVVAGDGPDRARLEALARTERVAERVCFLGKVTEAEKAALFALADLFAMPARIEGASVEGFGIVYIEAAFARLAALAGRAGGAGDAVLDGETGLLCDGADQESVTEALARLVNDADLRRSLGAAGEARARAKFGWEAGARAYLAALGLKA